MTISNHRHHPYNNEDVPEGKRLRMRDWLISRIGDPRYPGLTWVDKKEMIFSIPWKHAALHGWNQESDGALFRDWSTHTGACVRNAAPKQLKATFRCALHSLPDVHEIKDKAKKRGDDACRVFQIDTNPMTPHARKKLIRIRNHKNKEKVQHRAIEKRSSLDDFHPRQNLDSSYEWMQNQPHHTAYEEFQTVQDFNESQRFGSGNRNSNSNSNNNSNHNCLDNSYQIRPTVFQHVLTDTESYGSMSPASSHNAQSNPDIPHMLLPSPVEVNLPQTPYPGVGDGSPFHRNWYSSTDNSVAFSPPESTYSSGSMTSSPMPLSPQQSSYPVNPLSPPPGSMDTTIAHAVRNAVAIMDSYQSVGDDCGNNSKGPMSPAMGYYNQNVGFYESFDSNAENIFDGSNQLPDAYPIQQQNQQQSPRMTQETYSFVLQEKDNFPSIIAYDGIFKGQDHCQNQNVLPDNQMQQNYSFGKTHHIMENVDPLASMSGVQLDSRIGVDSLGADKSSSRQHWGSENCQAQQSTLPSASTLLTPSNSPNSSITSVPIPWTNTPRHSPTHLGFDMQFQATTCATSIHGGQQAFMTTAQSTTECFTYPDPSYYCNTGSYQPTTTIQCPNPSPTSPSYVYGGTR